MIKEHHSADSRMVPVLRCADMALCGLSTPSQIAGKLDSEALHNTNMQLHL